jgi:hypothetical protein
MLKLLHNLTMFSFEAQTVIGLRALKFVDSGPAAHAEARRMLTEKFVHGQRRKRFPPGDRLLLSSRSIERR